MTRSLALSSWRWPLALCAALALHVGALAAVATHWRPDAAPGSDVVAVQIDLEPAAATVAAAPPDALPMPQPVAPSPAQTDEPPPPAVPAEQPPPPVVRDEAPPEPPLEMPRKSSPVVLPAPARVASPPKSKPPAAKPAASAASPAPAAARTAAPSALSGRDAQAARASWQGRVVAQLNSRKQYPAAARSRGETGTATVHFSIDRSGRVLSAGLVRSSGSSALDAEASALVHRASPLPAPPPEVAGTRISLSVPIRFNLQ